MYYTKKQLANTPSRRDGVDANRELRYRQQCAMFIREMGQKLKLSSFCINTAIVYIHRFYMLHSMVHQKIYPICSAAIFLAAKVADEPRNLEHVVKYAYVCLHRKDPPKTSSDAYQILVKELIYKENLLLSTLGFEFTIDLPHHHVLQICKRINASKDLTQTSYSMASNSINMTTMCLEYKPTVVACFCIHFACKWSNWEIPRSSEGKQWFSKVDESVTLELLNQIVEEFLNIIDKTSSLLKRHILFVPTKQSPSNGPTAVDNSDENRSSSSKYHNHIPRIQNGIQEVKQVVPSTSQRHSTSALIRNNDLRNTGTVIIQEMNVVIQIVNRRANEYQKSLAYQKRKYTEITIYAMHKTTDSRL